MMTNSQPDFDLPTTATSTDKTFENAYDNSTLPAENPKPMRAIQTFMKRKTHVGKRAEAGLTADYAEFFIQKSANFSGSGVIDNAFENMAIDGIDNLRQYFANPNAPITLEIGFGMGGSLVEMASASPERNFVGIEVHEAGLGNCAFLAKGLGLSNLKLICGDAIGLLQQLPAEHLDTVQLYFPDPWQKKRHYKRRFVTAERMQIVASVLKSGGIFHAATDWEHYAFWMVAVLDAMPEFSNLAATTANAGSDFIPRPDFRPLTKFEKRGIEEGRGIWDVMYKKR